MKLYADTPARRSAQLVSDLLLVAWTVVWIWAGRVVHDTTAALAVPGRKLADAGDGLSGYMSEAGERAADIPVVGDSLRSPFDGAGSASRRLAEAGRDQQEAVLDLALLLGVVVAAVPILLLVAVWLPGRVRFVRRATAARGLIDADADIDLFALRALATQPMHVLARISDDPAGSWRRRDETVVRALAAVELRDSGLHLPSG